MKVFDELTNKNFELYAAHNYENPECIDVTEFKEDLSRFKYLKRLLRRYEVDEDLQERLILNHIIVLLNVFGAEAAGVLLLFKIDKEYWPTLVVFMKFLNMVPKEELDHVHLDTHTWETLQKI